MSYFPVFPTLPKFGVFPRTVITAGNSRDQYLPANLAVRPSAVDHSCPLNNFDTIQDNFTKLGTNIKHDQMTCRG